MGFCHRTVLREEVVVREFFTKYKANINIKTVNSLVSKWKRNGTVHNRNKSNSGRSKYVRTEEKVSNVK